MKTVIRYLQLLEEHMKADDKLHELIVVDHLRQTPEYKETARTSIEA